ncbi:MAG: AAA family ATPase [Alphaproteobacteria bacterium]|nr:AAA family ATPase [Alphaproteobacteria bacterium]MDE2336893.1 AAA family ATPase [Alphaproteobacteria bacterium]
MRSPLLIAVGGFSGSGKTSLAAALQQRLPDTVHLDSDRARKALFGVSETTRLPPSAYTQEATRRVIDAMERRVREHVAAGRNVVISALFSPAASRRDAENLAAETNARFAGLWLRADLRVLVGRVEKRAGNVSDAGAEIVRRQVAEGTETVLWPMLDATLPPDEVLAAALRMIGEQGGA